MHSPDQQRFDTLAALDTSGLHDPGCTPECAGDLCSEMLGLQTEHLAGLQQGTEHPGHLSRVSLMRQESWDMPLIYTDGQNNIGQVLGDLQEEPYSNPALRLVSGEHQSSQQQKPAAREPTPAAATTHAPAHLPSFPA